MPYRIVWQKPRRRPYRKMPSALADYNVAPGGWVMARRASRPATPYESTGEPTAKRVGWDPRMQPRSTKSAIVKLSYQFPFSFQETASAGSAQPLSFTLNNVPGLQQYSAVFSRFRVVKGDLTLPTLAQSNVESSSNTYLIVSSQPFAETAPPTSVGAASFVPSQAEDNLRQARWQRTIYPDTTTTGVTVGFKPYTLIAGYGPVTVAVSDQIWQRIWRGHNWTPFTWVTNNGLLYYGPYVLRSNTSTDDPEAWTPTVTVTLYMQFAGQK